MAAPPSPQTLQRLAEDPYWIALGHYETGKLGGWRSCVDDERFFLAETGDSDPAAELTATVAALYQDASLGDRHPQCRYPARTRWLRERLQLTDLPAPACSEFASWYHDINPHSTVLIFPAAYLNSPSSMFGHTLLRIDQPDVQENNTALLSYALNFGAFIEGADNSILYAWKGLMGGYPGLFALVPYRDKLKEYSRLENRDLWEYRLNLSAEETGRMVEHVWELRQVRFDYFFFDENCSYRLLELLEIARPGIELTEQFPLTAIPTDTVRAIKHAGLVERIDYRPSREKELMAARAAGQRRAGLGPAPGRRREPAGRPGLPRTARPAPRAGPGRRLPPGALPLHRRRTQRRTGAAQLPAAAGDQPEPAPALQAERPPLPEEGHESRTWQLGLGSREDRAFAEYGLRMAYHDLNDNLAGFPSARRSRSSSSSCASTSRTTGNCSSWISPPSARSPRAPNCCSPGPGRWPEAWNGCPARMATRRW